MMNFKHNKKRNPAFIFEALTREFAKAKLHKDENKINKINNFFTSLLLLLALLRGTF